MTLTRLVMSHVLDSRLSIESQKTGDGGTSVILVHANSLCGLGCMCVACCKQETRRRGG